VWILQCEKETSLTVVAFGAATGFSFQQCEASKDIPFRVFDDRQSVRAAAAAAVEFRIAKAIATASPQKCKSFRVEI
jgi:hypothetical protein